LPKVRDQIEQVHRRTVKASVPEITKFLEEVLTRQLIAYMTEVKDGKTVGRWASGDRNPDRETESRLRAIYQIFQILQAEESSHTVRAWFIGLNPQLDDESPATAIREGRAKDVLVAAKSWVAGG
jgi:hypothetical protein